MIAVTDTVRSVLDLGTFVYLIKCSAWLGDEILAEDVPIGGGTEDTDGSLNVPERITLSVPRVRDGFDWSPTTATSPLAAAGQTLKISAGVGVGADGVEWFQRGEYLIVESVVDGDTVRVTCAGLLYLIQEARFVAPFQPSGTIAGTLRALIEPALPADLDDAPDDRAVPVSAVNWDSDRLGAVYELLDAWPAVARMNAQGYLEVHPDEIPTEPVRAFSDAAPGTIVQATGSSTRTGGFNVVVATGYAADGGEVRATAYVGAGPWAYVSGPATPLPVPFGYSSPLLTTNAQCIKAANTVLNRKMRDGVLRRFAVTAVPDPTLEVGDAITVTAGDVDGLLCTVEALILPYTADGGPMRLTAVSTT